MESTGNKYYFICYLLIGEFPSTLSNSGEQNHSLIHVPILGRRPARNLACTIPCLPLMPLLSLNILDFGYAFPSLPHSSGMKNVNKYTQTYIYIFNNNGTLFWNTNDFHDLVFLLQIVSFPSVSMQYPLHLGPQVLLPKVCCNCNVF